LQAECVAKIFAASLFEGSANTFYFLLPHYSEGQTQFGLLHEDLTPRPAYVALVAVGRLLAAAKPAGRWAHEAKNVHGYLFRARPDAKEQFVLVAWCDGDGETRIRLNTPTASVFD